MILFALMTVDAYNAGKKEKDHRICKIIAATIKIFKHQPLLLERKIR